MKHIIKVFHEEIFWFDSWKNPQKIGEFQHIFWQILAHVSQINELQRLRQE